MQTLFSVTVLSSMFQLLGKALLKFWKMSDTAAVIVKIFFVVDQSHTAPPTKYAVRAQKEEDPIPLFLPYYPNIQISNLPLLGQQFQSCICLGLPCITLKIFGQYLNLGFYNPAVGYCFCKQVHVMAWVGFLSCQITWITMQLFTSRIKTWFCIFCISTYACILALAFPFPEGSTLFWDNVRSPDALSCCTKDGTKEGQAKIINFNAISASSWSCVIPVYTAAINLCLSKMVRARTLNIERAEEANLLYFDKDKPQLAIQCGWVQLVNSASTFSDPNCSVSFHDPLISVLSLSTLVSLSHNRIVPVSSNLISVGFQCACCWECVLVCQPLLLRDGITHPKMYCLICSAGDYWPWLLAPLVSLGFISDLNHYLHQGEHLSTLLPIRSSLAKKVRRLKQMGWRVHSVRCINISTH